MSFTAERLYNLLPAIDRLRDAEQDEPLKALLTVIAEQIAVLEDDLAQRYDDQFIETCADWVVPYIGDLLGVRLLHPVSPGTYSPRAYVANTLAYRRRKGTAAMLAQLAHEVTGWRVRVVEFFERLATTQHVNHPRLAPAATVDLRRKQSLEWRDTAFDDLAHTVDVRRIANGRGRYNLANVGIFVWRLNAYSLTATPAVRVDGWRYRFDPLGKDAPLFARPVADDELADPGAPVLPLPISRRLLAQNLESYYGPDKSLFLWEDGRGIVPQPGQPLADLIEVRDLRDVADGKWAYTPTDKIALDPVLGRIAFPATRRPPRRLQVAYHYGFSAALGGGEYERAHSFDKPSGDAPPPAIIQVPDDLPDERFPIRAAFAQLADRDGVVEITDSRRSTEPLTINVAAGKQWVLRAADQRRPTLLPAGGEIRISGGEGAQLTLNGLLIAGRLRVSGSLSRLCLRHCTLVPGWGGSDTSTPSSLMVETPDAGKLTIEVDHCIVGPLRLPAKAVVLQVRDSIIDARADERWALAAPDERQLVPPTNLELADDQPALAAAAKDPPAGPPTSLERVTVIGKVHVSELTEVANTLITGQVVVERRQVGEVRFSALPKDSVTPRRYRCQELPADRVQVERLLTSRDYGDPGYAQLSQTCPLKIRQGAEEGGEEGGEMGAFYELKQPQRETNLQVILDEYLRFNLEAGIFYID